MFKHTIVIAAAAGTIAASGASADIVESNDPGVYAPFNNAVAEIVWIESKAGYTGELSWMGFAGDESRVPVSDVMLWNNKQAQRGAAQQIPMVFSMGDRLDFEYEIIRGGIDTFSTADTNDWQQFRVDATDPLRVLVEVEDIRLPKGDADYNDVRFEVVFSQVVPAPGAVALLGMGGLIAARRRR